MKMTPGSRAIDKMFKRRDRYEIPDWQREEVWDDAKKQRLIDSILRGWKLPKFYFLRTGDDKYEVVDGQQRLAAIYEFFENKLSAGSWSREFGGPLYRNLVPAVSDSFDDFEIEYDLIEDANEAEIRDFFQRLQSGLPLTSSERLNAVHSKLRDFCRSASRKHPFFKDTVAIGDTRYAHFDICAKVAAIEIEGLDAGLRFEDIKQVFESNGTFSTNSAVAKRIRGALDFLNSAFGGAGGVAQNANCCPITYHADLQTGCDRANEGKRKRTSRVFREVCSGAGGAGRTWTQCVR